MTKTLRPTSLVQASLLTALAAALFLVLAPRSSCPHEGASGWLSTRKPVACHGPNDPKLARLTASAQERFRAGDLEEAVRLQRAAIRRVESMQCVYECEHHHDQLRYRQLAKLGRYSGALMCVRYHPDHDHYR